MSDAEIPQDPKGYYYAPAVENGPFQNQFSELGRDGGQLVVAAVLVFAGGDPARATNTAMGSLGNFVGSIGSSVLGAVGQAIDNLPTIEKNLDTLWSELNDSSSWMAPEEQ